MQSPLREVHGPCGAEGVGICYQRLRNLKGQAGLCVDLLLHFCLCLDCLAWNRLTQMPVPPGCRSSVFGI